jgi:4,5-dihydroxyphthalate decarboxylase
MSDLRLSLAINDYVHTRDIADARIKPVGIDLIVNNLTFEQASFRFGAHLEFDISEYSLANYCARISASGPAEMVALPVFTSRAFRHSSIFINEASGITSAAELAGKTVGIPQWSQTATVYVRGYLMHQVGVPLSSIKWIQAGVDQPGRRDQITSRLPAGVHLESRPDRTLSDMLATGELGAIISARPPRCFFEGAPGVRRLFPDYRNEEEQYFARTKIFPIMHVIAIKRKIYDANPWIARNLFDAFETAKRASLIRLQDIQTSHLPTGWGSYDLQRSQRLLFGTSEPWPYGLEGNRDTLEPFLTYCDEQGITQRLLQPEDLFAKETTLEMPI